MIGAIGMKRNRWSQTYFGDAPTKLGNWMWKRDLREESTEDEF